MMQPLLEVIDATKIYGGGFLQGGKEVVALKTQSYNTTKGLDEMRQDVKDIAAKLDSLLKQLMDWLT